MDINTVHELIIAILPSMTAICGIIFTAIKIFSQFNDLIKKVDDKTDLADAKTQMEGLISENRLLRKEVADLLTEVRKVKYEYDDIVNNKKV